MALSSTGSDPASLMSSLALSMLHLQPLLILSLHHAGLINNELDRVWSLVDSDGLGVFLAVTGFQIGGDAGGPEGVAIDRFSEACFFDSTIYTFAKVVPPMCRAKADWFYFSSLTFN